MNGVAENKNQVLQYYDRTMLIHANLGKQYWAEAVDTGNYLINRLPSSAVDDQIPFTLWTGRKPSLAHVRVFGSPAYVYVPEAQCSKFDARSQVFILVGFHDSLKCYKVLHPVSHKPQYARSVVIHESAIMDARSESMPNSENTDSYLEPGGEDHLVASQHNRIK